MKRILIITYYWPPSGGAGVQRWLKFVKYLREFGYEPVIFKPQNPEYPVVDNSLESNIPEGIEVIEQKIWEPYNLYKSFIGQSKKEKINTGFLSENKKPKRSEKLSVWLRGNLFIPDARKYWIKPSYKRLKTYLKDNPVDAIVSTGPPHSAHMIGLKLKRKLHLPWLADFRDPWTNIDFYSELMLTKWADKKHKRLEKQVLSEADVVVSVGNTMSAEFKALGAARVETITNGYDVENPEVVDLSNKFSLAHIGTLVKSRNPIALWEALQQLTNKDEDFKQNLEITLIGKVDVHVLDSLQQYGLSEFVKKIDYLPHNQVTIKQRESQILLLLSNNTPNAKGILTGKFFEYMAAKRPILAIGHPDGDMAQILVETKSGTIHNFDDVQTIKKQLEASFDKFKKGNLHINSSGYENYSRKALTKKLAKVLDSII